MLRRAGPDAGAGGWDSRARIAELRDKASPGLVEDVLDAVAGDVSWHDIEATRRAAIQKLAGRAADALETLIGELRQVAASFDDVLSAGDGEAGPAVTERSATA